MDWHCLGHAMWLAEVEGLRLLFDPLLADSHHGGVFEVFPPRTIDADALRADFIVISHRHPDHFDLRSLRKLAAVDPDSVIVTSDELVASCARRLGFSSTRVVPPETTIELDGPTLITTPSAFATDPEWGVIIADKEGVVYNQVDTSAGSPADVRAFFARVFTALASSSSSPASSTSVTLALARWQPLLEVEAMIAGAIGFPFRAYADELARCAAIGARVVTPSAAGTTHTGPFAFMNRLVYPVSEDRFIEDARRRLPATTRIEPCVTGATYRIRHGDVAEIDRNGARDLVSISMSPPPPPDPRSFRPLEIPGIVDPNLDGRAEPHLRARVDAWIRTTLARVLTRPKIRYVLEVIFPNSVDTYTIIDRRVTIGEVASAQGWDVRCAVAGSLLVDVLDHRRHWGELLLGGMLRAASRAYEIDADGMRPVPLQPLFVYEALSYEESVLEALEFEISRDASPHY